MVSWCAPGGIVVRLYRLGVAFRARGRGGGTVFPARGTRCATARVLRLLGKLIIVPVHWALVELHSPLMLYFPVLVRRRYGRYKRL